jgi:peptidoglycan/LPS O-acetylase OafA/YrhL
VQVLQVAIAELVLYSPYWQNLLILLPVTLHSEFSVLGQLAVAILSFALTAAVASVSFYGVELPFLRMRRASQRMIRIE